MFGKASDLINELSDEQTKEKFELDDILYDISMKIFNYRKSINMTKKEFAQKIGNNKYTYKNRRLFL